MNRPLTEEDTKQKRWLENVLPDPQAVRMLGKARRKLKHAQFRKNVRARLLHASQARALIEPRELGSTYLPSL